MEVFDPVISEQQVVEHVGEGKQVLSSMQRAALNSLKEMVSVRKDNMLLPVILRTITKTFLTGFINTIQPSLC